MLNFCGGTGSQSSPIGRETTELATVRRVDKDAASFDRKWPKERLVTAANSRPICHMLSAGALAYIGVWGLNPQWGSEAESSLPRSSDAQKPVGSFLMLAVRLTNVIHPLLLI